MTTVFRSLLAQPGLLTRPLQGMKEIADKLHAAGAYLYMDGANLNALMGAVRPADLGVDAMHINLHKSFSTPHGGGGPGSGKLFPRPVPEWL
jgi:glycine dehydrogenase subunit 2